MIDTARTKYVAHGPETLKNGQYSELSKLISQVTMQKINEKETKKH